MKTQYHYSAVLSEDTSLNVDFENKMKIYLIYVLLLAVVGMTCNFRSLARFLERS